MVSHNALVAGFVSGRICFDSGYVFPFHARLVAGRAGFVGRCLSRPGLLEVSAFEKMQQGEIFALLGSDASAAKLPRV
jgi:hypothetical protein